LAKSAGKKTRVADRGEHTQPFASRALDQNGHIGTDPTLQLAVLIAHGRPDHCRRNIREARGKALGDLLDGLSFIDCQHTVIVLSVPVRRRAFASSLPVVHLVVPLALPGTHLVVHGRSGDLRAA